jgi:hypothetical protein
MTQPTIILLSQLGLEREIEAPRLRGQCVIQNRNNSSPNFAPRY